MDIGNASGRRISDLKLCHEDLRFELDDGSMLRVWDDGQCCCESRYLTCDDHLEHFRGSILAGMEVRAAPTVEDDDGDVHESDFLIVSTSLGTFTVCSHNRHNGYYGGICLRTEFAMPPARQRTRDADLPQVGSFS